MTIFQENTRTSSKYIKSILHTFLYGGVMFPRPMGSDKIDISEYEGEYDEDDCFVIQTSGSTSKHKAVVLGREAIKSNAESLISFHGFKKGDVHASCLPLHHVNALCMSVIAIHIAGAKLEYLNTKNMTEYFKFIDNTRSRTATIVPALIQNLVEEKPKFPDCLEYLITASAPLSSSLAKQFYELYGNRLVQGYGLSEAVNFSFTMPKLNNKQFINEYINNYPPVGIPLKDVEYIIDNNGEVLIHSKSMFTRYQNNIKETNKSFVNIKGKKYLKTGDKGHNRNGYLILDGRIKEIINIGGETFYPKDIENEWQKQNIKAIAFPINSNRLDNEIGMECTIDNYKNANPIPSGIIINSKNYTETYKPQRIKMGLDMEAFNFSVNKYNSMINSAVFISNILSIEKPKTKKAKSIINKAKNVLKQYNINGNEFYQEPIFNWIINNSFNISEGLLDGSNFIKENKLGWQHLMNNLMGIYPKSINTIMKKMNINGKVLELGSGVGNLTNIINKYCEVIPSDLSINFMNKFNNWDNAIRIDFDKPFNIPNNLDAIVACNSLHCAKNIYYTISNIYSVMHKNSYLIIGEGEKEPIHGKKWAFDFLFELFDGWYNNNGFLKEEEWIYLLKDVGFDQIKINRIRSGSNKLGFVLVCQK